MLERRPASCVSARRLRSLRLVPIEGRPAQRRREPSRGPATHRLLPPKRAGKGLPPRAGKSLEAIAAAPVAARVRLVAAVVEEQAAAVAVAHHSRVMARSKS